MKTKEQQMTSQMWDEFSGLYDTMASYFGGDDVMYWLNQKSTDIKKLGWLRTNVKRLEKYNKQGRPSGLTRGGTTLKFG
jgi:hypothetical protein